MVVKPKSSVLGLQACYHGSLDRAEMESLGLDPDAVVDFSVNCNPLGTSEKVRTALNDVPVVRYPDRRCASLRRALSECHHVPVDCVALGNGSVELIWATSLAFLDPGDPVLIAGPTFGEYETASRIAGAAVVAHHAEESDGFAVDVGRVVSTVRKVRPKLVFLCNPNNPTGRYLERDDVERLLFECTDSLVVVDEAYIGFVENADSLVDLIERSNLVLLRSMTKDHALAGLRVGFALACPAVVAALEKVRPPWSVNAFAQAAALASLRDPEHLERSRAEVFAARRVLIEGLQGLGLDPIPSRANFVLVQVGSAGDFRRRLLREGYCVRDCASFGLPSYVRIAVRTRRECEALLSAMRRVLIRGC